MAARKLTDAQWEALDDLRFSTTDATVFRNATVILMTAVGRSKFAIAHDLGCCSSTVDHVRQRYRECGLDGLRPKKPTGRPSAATSLNLIERLWGHLKRTVLVNVLYANLGDLVAAFRKVVSRLTGNRERMGYMFDHDDLMQKPTAKTRRVAA